jgi:SAM-dependent methyltransferase
VLDVAAGAGYVAAAAARRGARAIGLDFSESQVVLARSTLPQIDFRQGDAESLPFDDDRFEAVVMGFGLNHLPHPERAFLEAYRVLRRGGHFAFTVWAAPKSGEAFGFVLGAIQEHGEAGVQLPPAPPYFRFADAEDVRRVFDQPGLSNLAPRSYRNSGSITRRIRYSMLSTKVPCARQLCCTPSRHLRATRYD